MHCKPQAKAIAYTRMHNPLLVITLLDWFMPVSTAPTSLQVNRTHVVIRDFAYMHSRVQRICFIRKGTFLGVVTQRFEPMYLAGNKPEQQNCCNGV